jgi:DNA-binding PadR family transcriptional regulator
VRTAILALLAEQPRNGYQIMRELEQRSQGGWRPSPGAVYPALQQLEDEGLVRVEASGAVPNGRVYQLTPAGQTYVAEHKEEIENAATGGNQALGADATVIAGATQLRHVAAASMQLLQSGSEGDAAEALKILTRARRDLYRLLAGGEDDDAGDDE